MDVGKKRKLSPNLGNEEQEEEEDVKPAIILNATSMYHKYYFIYKENDVKYGKCYACERNQKTKIIKMTGHNTSGLKKHLQSFHKDIMPEFATKKCNNGNKSKIGETSYTV